MYIVGKKFLNLITISEMLYKLNAELELYQKLQKKSEQLLNVNAKPFQIQRGINLKTEKSIKTWDLINSKWVD